MKFTSKYKQIMSEAEGVESLKPHKGRVAMKMKKGRLSKDIWYINEDASLGCCLSKKEIDESVFRIGKKGDEVVWNGNGWDWDGGEFEEGSEFVEEIFAVPS